MAKLISIGQIIDDTWENYTDNFKSWMKISSLLFIVSAFWIIGYLLSPTLNTNFLIEQGLITPIQTFGLALSAFASLPLKLAVSFWIAIMFVDELMVIKNKKKFSLKKTTFFGLKKFLPAFVVTILQLIIIASSVLALLPGLLLIILNGKISGGAVLGSVSLLVFFLGNIAALILLIFLGLTVAFAIYELLVGEKSILQSIKGSYKLIKGRFWSVLLRWVAPKILILAGTLFIDIALTVIFILVFGRVLESQLLLQQVSAVITHLAGVGVLVLTAPLWIIADFILYDSLRSNK